MKDIRTKLAVAAVIFGLGGLGGYAMASNPAGQARVQSAAIASHTGQGGKVVTTRTSGAPSASAINAPVTQTPPRAGYVGGGSRDD